VNVFCTSATLEDSKSCQPPSCFPLLHFQNTKWLTLNLIVSIIVTESSSTCLSIPRRKQIISSILIALEVFQQRIAIPVCASQDTSRTDDKCAGSTDSNKAVNISLVAPSDAGTKTLYTFNPKMTYSIFGEEESIFGYQGLKINLRYNACDMRPGLQIQYTRKFKAVGETAPTDLKPLLEEYLPKSELIRNWLLISD
jgi:hypothetical protein